MSFNFKWTTEFLGSALALKPVKGLRSFVMPTRDRMVRGLRLQLGFSWYVIQYISWSPCDSKTSCYQLCQGPLMDWVRGFQTSLLPVWIIHVLGKGYLSYWDCLCHLCVWTHHFQVWEPNTSVQTFLKPAEISWHQLLMPWLLIYFYSFGFARWLLKTVVVVFSVLSLVFSLHCSCCSKSSSWL